MEFPVMFDHDFPMIFPWYFLGINHVFDGWPDSHCGWPRLSRSLMGRRAAAWYIDLYCICWLCDYMIIYIYIYILIFHTLFFHSGSTVPLCKRILIVWMQLSHSILFDFFAPWMFYRFTISEYMCGVRVPHWIFEVCNYVFAGFQAIRRWHRL